jgi:hypothetical protein
MSIIITNPNSKYERFSVKLLYSYALNLKGIGFNLHTKSRRSWVQLITVSKNDQE